MKRRNVIKQLAGLSLLGLRWARGPSQMRPRMINHRS